MTLHKSVIVLLGLALVACRSDERTAQGIAERFVDEHYVQINLPATKPLCVGLDLKKIEEEERLVAGQVIDDSTRKPTVHYKLIEKKEAGDRPSFVFEGRIQIDTDDPLVRKWIVTTRREGEAWKVSNFEEFD